MPLVYLNLVGGQDELVFDGASMVFDGAGELLYRSPQFVEDLFWVDVPLSEAGRSDVQATVVSRGTLLEGEPAALRRPTRRSTTSPRSTAPSAWAWATTSARTASRRWCWACRAASTRR